MKKVGTSGKKGEIMALICHDKENDNIRLTHDVTFQNLATIIDMIEMKIRGTIIQIRVQEETKNKNKVEGIKY